MGELTLDDSRAADGRLEANVTVGGQHRRLFVECLDGALSPGCADALVLGAIAIFMHRREPLHVAAPVTRRLLGGLEEWQRVWSRWKQASYAAIEVTADQVVVGYPTSSKAVTTFTGGVDSTYSVHRHVTGAAGNATVDLRAAVFVHGFDIPLGDREGFDASCRKPAEYLERAGVDLVRIRSNLREVGNDWRDEHALAVASVLTALAPAYGVGLIAATAPYHSAVIRWGSNPITDPLLSSGMMDIRYDGADASRVEKLAALSSDALAISQLRFCWESEPYDENCGVCSKCIHTACSLMAIGVRDAGCFTRWPTVDEIRFVRIATPGVLEGMSWVIEYATAAGRAEEEWCRALRDATESASLRGPDE